METCSDFEAALVEAGRIAGPVYGGRTVPRKGRIPAPAHRHAAESLVLGVDAALSHTGAACYWGLDPFSGLPASPECSIPMGKWLDNPLVHQRRRFSHLDLVVRGPIAVTTVTQTLADLGAVVDADVVERAVESAIRLGFVTDDQLREVVGDPHPTWFRTGMVALRTVLARRPPGAAPTGSDAETVCLQHYRAVVGLPEPRRQFPILGSDGRLVGHADFGFPPARFFTEVDGLGAHGSETALAYDLNRQNRASDAEYDFRRFTAVDVYHRPAYVCRETLTGLRLSLLTRGPVRTG